MTRLGAISKIRKRVLLRVLGLAAVIMTAMFGLLGATPNSSRCQAQSVAAVSPAYEYDVVSVKPSNPANSGKPGNGTLIAPDGFTAKNTSLMSLVHYAFGILNDEQLAGAPSWISSEQFDVDARMDTSVADALRKLTKDDRALARQHMLQGLLADRFKLAFHRETRELSVYSLVIAKSGSKLREAKPDDTYPNGFKDDAGHPFIGGVTMSGTSEGETMTGQATPIDYFVRILSREVKRIVINKTGLTGNFDFTMQFMPEQRGMQTASESASPLPALDPGIASIFTALQEQLGLKLEAGKAPIEVVVIDHLERPSGN